MFGRPRALSVGRSTADRSTANGVPGILRRMDDGVALLAGGELDHALSIQVGERDEARLVTDGRIVEAGAAALDQAPGLAVAGGKSTAREQLEHGDAAFQLVAWQVERRQVA